MIETMRKSPVKGSVTLGYNLKTDETILWGSRTDPLFDGTRLSVHIQAIVIKSPSGIRAVREKKTAEGHQIDLYGYSELGKDKNRRYLEAFELAGSIQETDQMTVDDLDERNRTHFLMIKLLSLDEIMAGLPPLNLHLTGPGNKYETKACAEVWGVSEEEARRALILTPNSDRVLGPIGK